MATLNQLLVDELTAINRAYNEVIRLAVKVGDNGTRELLESILVDGEDLIDWVEAQQDQIAQMGIEDYLAHQID